jgi:tetratricopeptide (TPR) repeat protein
MTSPLHRSWIVLAISLVSIAAVLIYGNTVSNSFVYDDDNIILNSRFIRSWRNLPALFNPDYFASSREGTYRPVATLSYLIDHSIWKLQPVGYHLTNVLVHTANGILLFLFLQHIWKGWQAALACALLFVAHPINTESINVVSFREELLVLFFSLCSFLAYCRIKPGDPHRWRYSCISIACLVFALFSKEIAFFLPFLFIVYEICFGEEGIRGVGQKRDVYIMLSIVLALYAVIYFILLPYPGLLDDPELAMYRSLPYAQRILMFSNVIFFYLKTLLFPVVLSADYADSLYASFWNAGVIVSSLCLLTILAVSIAARRRMPAVLFGVSWFFLLLIPVSNIAPLDNPIAERYLYMPAIGVYIVLVSLGKELFDRFRAASRFLIAALLIIVLSFYGYRSFLRNRDWRDPITLWSKTIETAPESTLAQYNLGLAYYKAALYDHAVEAFQKAVRMGKNEVACLTNLGATYYALNEKEKAITLYERAIEIDPDHALVYLNLGNAYSDLGRHEEAIQAYEKAIELDPDYAEVYSNLGTMYHAMGEIEKAKDLYRRAIEIDPYHGSAYNNLAIAHYQEHEFAKAIEYCDRARKLGMADPALMVSLEPYRHVPESK